MKKTINHCDKFKSNDEAFVFLSKYMKMLSIFVFSFLFFKKTVKWGKSSTMYLKKQNQKFKYKCKNWQALKTKVVALRISEHIWFLYIINYMKDTTQSLLGNAKISKNMVPCPHEIYNLAPN
jgi:hypothetical protein